MQLNLSSSQEKLSLVIQRARRGLVDFEMMTSDNYDPNWHHVLVARELEHIQKHGARDYKILIVTVPPRHGKSQQCSIDFPAWCFGNDPKTDIIATSYSADLAVDFGAKTRDKVDSDRFKIIFPNVALKEDQKAKGRWMTNHGGSYTAAGVGGPITGRGARILLIDDPVKNREEADSEVMQEKIWDWFTSVAYTRLSPNGVIVIIMTRWHLNDLAGRILTHPDLSKRTKLIRLPAIAERDGKHRLHGEPLWPTHFSQKNLLETKAAIGPYDWQALYQGSPILTERQEFKPEWYKTITEGKLAAMNCRRFLTVDTAMSMKTQADYTGFCDNRVSSQNYWNLAAWQMKIGPEELVDAIFNLHKSNRYEAIGIEKTTYTEGLKPYIELEMRRRKSFLPIVELEHKQVSKEIRIRGLIPRYYAGSIYHIEGQCKELEAQLMHFPAGIHDDVIDAVAYQLQVADSPELRGAGLSVHIPDDY